VKIQHLPTLFLPWKLFQNFRFSDLSLLQIDKLVEFILLVAGVNLYRFQTAINHVYSEPGVQIIIENGYKDSFRFTYQVLSIN